MAAIRPLRQVFFLDPVRYTRAPAESWGQLRAPVRQRLSEFACELITQQK